MGGFLACILAGAAMSIQGVMNTRLSEHIGTMETNAFVQCVAAALALLVLLQIGLGIATLLQAVPVLLGALHQAGAILVLTATLAALYLLRDERSGA